MHLPVPRNIITLYKIPQIDRQAIGDRLATCQGGGPCGSGVPYVWFHQATSRETVAFAYASTPIDDEYCQSRASLCLLRRSSSICQRRWWQGRRLIVTLSIDRRPETTCVEVVATNNGRTGLIVGSGAESWWTLLRLKRVSRQKDPSACSRQTRSNALIRRLSHGGAAFT